MRDLNTRRADSSVVIFFLFAAKQDTKQCNQSEKRKRQDNRFTIFYSVWMRRQGKLGTNEVIYSALKMPLFY
jgi:hypothetical protein